jgi:uncharacterized membrane protein
VAVMAARLQARRLEPVRFHPLADLILTILLVGPLVGPIFHAWGWPVLEWINWPIYLLGENVCPQPIFRLAFLGAPMVVCSRCWAAVGGLWVIRLAYGRWGRGANWRTWLTVPEGGRVVVALLLFTPWVLDIVASDLGWWASDHPLMILLGFAGGLGAGQLILPYAVRRLRPGPAV